MKKGIIFIEDKITEHSKIPRKHSKELREIKLLVQKSQEEREADREKVVWLERRIARLEEKVGI